jgi:hypothetical protein
VIQRYHADGSAGDHGPYVIYNDHVADTNSLAHQLHEALAERDTARAARDASLAREDGYQKALAVVVQERNEAQVEVGLWRGGHDFKDIKLTEALSENARLRFVLGMTAGALQTVPREHWSSPTPAGDEGYHNIDRLFADINAALGEKGGAA